jgi:hypothetical protein
MKRVRWLVLCGAAAVAFLLAARAAPAADAPGATALDHLKIARDFADCMIKYGRDRYGKVQSPLFANSLTREREPTITPYPLFAEPNRTADYMTTPFRMFNFNACTNYPPGLGAEGPHKVTVYGCDPYEDRELYEMLFDLTRITGNPVYREEAEKALQWWFRNTQGPAGLFPWGEHLGWDFQYDCPTYFDGPSQYLYAACYHEIKDDVPFLDVLARIPAARAGDPTPLERYALGVWNAHFWDKDRAYYCRHGDYTGKDDRNGSDAGFPAHLGAYMRVWAAAYLASARPDFKKQMEGVFGNVLDMAISRSEKYGFFPLTFAPELAGKDPGKQAPEESVRLSRHAAEVADQLAQAAPQIEARLRRLSEVCGGPQKSSAPPIAAPAPVARAANLPKQRFSGQYADEIIRWVKAYRQYGNVAYLEAAQTMARGAYGDFCDDTCPLPKALARGTPLATAAGDPFPDFYFRGAKLMHAFALLGEAMLKKG